MVVVPAGSFLMGAPADELGRDDIEGPQHRVTIAQFAAGKYDVTRAEWKLFVKATNRKSVGGCAWTPSNQDLNPDASWERLGFTQDDTHPVVCVSWADAQDYVQWLAAKTAKKYRLPSEAEWEYAARAGSTKAYPWGPPQRMNMRTTGRKTVAPHWPKITINGKKLRPSAHSLRTSSAYTTCTGTYCSGCKTASPLPMRKRLPMELRTSVPSNCKRREISPT
jgi:formylglycine-generating enzyme required for sulfatase activity